MKTTDRFLINGKPMLIPDAEVGFNYEDIDSSDSGRDQSGFMHRVVIRYKVPSWSFKFAALTDEELCYLESLFPEEPSFQFTHPSRLDSSTLEITECYRSKFGIAWQNAATGLWSGCSFNIIEC